MAWDQPGTKIGQLGAAADLSAKQFFAVAVNSSSQWAVASAGQRSIGVLYNAPSTAGDACEVVVTGIVKASAGGTITAGDPISVDSSGEFVSGGDNDYQVGVALVSAVDGDIFTLWLTGGNGLIEATSPA